MLQEHLCFLLDNYLAFIESIKDIKKQLKEAQKKEDKEKDKDKEKEKEKEEGKEKAKEETEEKKKEETKEKMIEEEKKSEIIEAASDELAMDELMDMPMLSRSLSLPVPMGKIEMPKFYHTKPSLTLAKGLVALIQNSSALFGNH